MKTLIKEIKPSVKLYRNNRTGLAWIENGETGNIHSCHPNIDVSGSVKGMKKLGYWRQNDITVRSNGAIYNVSKLVITDDLDKIVADYCQCEGCRLRRMQ